MLKQAIFRIKAKEGGHFELLMEIRILSFHNAAIY
jgi:hypothetical protein